MPRYIVLAQASDNTWRAFTLDADLFAGWRLHSLQPKSGVVTHHIQRTVALKQVSVCEQVCAQVCVVYNSEQWVYRLTLNITKISSLQPRV